MALFRSTKDIYKTYGEEVYNSNFMDSNTIVSPKKGKWDYKRELKIEDVEIWEVLYEDTLGWAIYAAWNPYAEFYMIRCPIDHANGTSVYNTYYGAGSQDQIVKFMLENNIHINFNKIWVEPDEMWLYQPPDDKKIILI
jgi:hypothetical protein